MQQTLQSAANSLILSKLLAFLHHLDAPFIIGGDWQNEPAALASTVIQSKFRATIVDTQGNTTLRGSQLDYLLVANTLVGSMHSPQRLLGSALETSLRLGSQVGLRSTGPGSATSKVSTHWTNLSTLSFVDELPRRQWPFPHHG